MQKSIKWGILGCGRIAHKFASDIALVPDAKLVAVASRDLARAKAFGSQFHVEQCYDSYEALAKDPEVDVVYVATIHPEHAAATVLCLNYGKAVLCEKPLAMNGEEVLEMVNAAKSNKRFLMEAIWTRFIPAIQRMLELLEEGVIGDTKAVHADFGFEASSDKVRLFDNSMGGGALLDIGIYPLFVTLLTLGMPTSIYASTVITERGIDLSTAMLLSYEGGGQAVLSSNLAVNTQNEAWIHGTKGSIKLHRPFHQPSKLSIVRAGKVEEEIDLPLLGNGYTYEIQHVNQCLQQGYSESPLMSLDFSLQLMQLLDRVREKIGLKY